MRSLISMFRLMFVFILFAAISHENISLAQNAPAKQLPRVLLIGDSISIGYTPFVKELLKGKAEVVRIGEETGKTVNGGDSGNVLANVKQWIGEQKFDVIHVNCGLHDLKYTVSTSTFQQSPEKYEQNLKALAAWAKDNTQATWIFANTTPVNDERSKNRKASFERFNKDVEKYNAVAAQVMKETGWPVNNLYQTVEQAGRDTSLGKDGVHFTPAAYQMLAKQVAETITAHLPKK